MFSLYSRLIFLILLSFHIGSVSEAKDVKKKTAPHSELVPEKGANDYSRQSASGPKKQGKRKTVRTKTDHKKAYQPKKGRGEHLDIKVTPPEKRGKKGFVLVEMYNNSKKDLSIVSFTLKLDNRGWYKVSADVSFEDLPRFYSKIKEFEVPGNGKIPKVMDVKAVNLNILDSNAYPVKLDTYIDLIKR